MSSKSFSFSQLLAAAKVVEKPKEICALVKISLGYWDMGKITHHELATILDIVSSTVRKKG